MQAVGGCARLGEAPLGTAAKALATAPVAGRPGGCLGIRSSCVLLTGGHMDVRQIVCKRTCWADTNRGVAP